MKSLIVHSINSIFSVLSSRKDKNENGYYADNRKSISVKYSEIGYIILRVFDENVIKKWLILVKTVRDSCWPTIELEKTSVKMFLLVFSELAHVIL